MQSRHLFLIIGFFALSACGGGGAGSLGSDNLPGPPAFNALLLEGEAVLDKADGLAPSESLPAIDGVGYDGIMALATDFDTATEGYFGDFSATVNFAAGDMTGTGSSFFFAGVDSEGNPSTPGQSVAGDVTVTSSNVGLGTVDFEMSGTLFVDGSVATVNSGVGAGTFTGTDGDILNILGVLEFDGTDTTLGALIVAD